MFSQALINTDISKLLYLQQFPYQNKAHDLISSDFIEISLKHIDKMQSKKYHTVNSKFETKNRKNRDKTDSP
jgi:hypothetical protein